MARIFISYKREDKEKVFKIKDQIEKAICEECWIDLDGIESDAQFMNVIIKAINASEIVLFMYSKAHSKISKFDKDWTVRELNFAAKKNKRIVFINLDDSALTDQFEFMYGTQQQIRASSIDSMSNLFRDLRKWMNKDEHILSNTNSTTNINISNNNAKNISSVHLSHTHTFCVNGVEFNMIRVEGGTFSMGEVSKFTYFFGERELNKHDVTLHSYAIGETPVTQALWKAVMGNNPSKFKGDENPVECVSWTDCQEFIKRISKITNTEFSLLTEAQWEFAARGGNKYTINTWTGVHYSGAGPRKYKEVAWCKENSGKTTHPVKTKKPNELGIYDMSGNVWEWCIDRYGNYTFSHQYDPIGPSKGSERVIRGGSWYNDFTNLTVTCRNKECIDKRFSNIGFRLCIPDLETSPFFK